MSRDTVVSPLAPGSGRILDWTWDIYTPSNNALARGGSPGGEIFWSAAPSGNSQNIADNGWYAFQLGGTAFGAAGGADTLTTTTYCKFAAPSPYGARVATLPEIDCLSYLSYRFLVRCLANPTQDAQHGVTSQFGSQGIFFHANGDTGTAPGAGGPINQTGQKSCWGIVGKSSGVWELDMKLSTAADFQSQGVAFGYAITDWHWIQCDWIYGTDTELSGFNWLVDGTTIVSLDFNGVNLPGLTQASAIGAFQWFAGIMGSGTAGNTPVQIAAARVIGGPNTPSVF